MKTTISGRNIAVTEDQKLIIEKKLSRFDKFFKEPAEAFAVLRKSKRCDIVEITINAGGMLYRSEVEDESWMNALDQCVEHIDGQIRKNKTRLAKRLRDETFLSLQTTINPQDETEESDFVIHEKRFSIKPMSIEEAILQMNLLGHNFFVFKDSVDECMRVVYKRKDGAYGCISDTSP